MHPNGGLLALCHKARHISWESNRQESSAFMIVRNSMKRSRWRKEGMIAFTFVAAILASGILLSLTLSSLSGGNGPVSNGLDPAGLGSAGLGSFGWFTFSILPLLVVIAMTIFAQIWSRNALRNGDVDETDSQGSASR